MSLAKAQRDLERLRSDAQRLRQHLADVEAKAVKVAHYIEMAKVYGFPEIEEGAPEPESPHVSASTPNRSGVPPINVRTAIRILRESGRPMRTRDLVSALEREGIHIGSQNPVTNLSGALSRWKDLLVANRSEGWRLAEWVYDASNVEAPETKPDTEEVSPSSMKEAPETTPAGE